MEGVVSEYWSSVSWSGRLTHGHLAQHHNIHLKCCNAWYDCGYVQIVAFAISDALA